MAVTDAVRRVRIETTSTGADKATADLRQLSAAQKGVAVASDQTTKATLSLDAALERSRRGLDQEYRATARARQETNLWNQALSRGNIDLAEHSTRLTQIAAKYDQVAIASSRASRGGMGSALLGGLGVGIGTGALLGLPILISKAREAVSSLDDLGDAAERAGISGERLQILRYALEQNAGSAEDADSAFSRLNKTIGDVATGRNAAAAKVFHQLGIDVKDAAGNVKDTGIVFDEFADKIKDLGGIQEDASRASVIFGREAGPGLAALLQQGAAGVKRYGEQISIFSDEALAKADKLDKRLNEISQRWDYLWKNAVVGGLDLFSGENPAAGAMQRFKANQPVLELQKKRAELAEINKRLDPGRSKTGFGARLFGPSELQDVERQAQLQQEIDSAYGGIMSAPGGMGFQKPLPVPVTPITGGAPSSGAHGPGWTSGADIYNQRVAKAQDDLTKATQRYIPVRSTATNEDHLATIAQERYQNAVDASISKMDDLRGSVKSLIDEAVHGGNVLQALGDMLLDFGSTGLTNALFGAQGTSGGGLFAPLLGKMGLGAPTPIGAQPINMSYDPLSSIGQSAGSGPASATGGAPVGAVTSAALGALGAMAAPASGAGGAGWGSAIASSAAKFGIDPSVMTRVGKSEGLGSSWQSNYINSAGARETSYGPFQLYTGGGLGNVFQKQTGLDLTNAALFKNPVNMQLYTDFVAQQASMSGWGAWYGAANVGISPWQGIGLFHSGGMVGEAGPSRMISAAAFIGAPRMHSGGLAPDERPAILQTGERVLSRAEVRSGRGSGGIRMGDNHFHINGDPDKRTLAEMQNMIAVSQAQQQEQMKRDIPTYQRSSRLLRE